MRHSIKKKRKTSQKQKLKKRIKKCMTKKRKKYRQIVGGDKTVVVKFYSITCGFCKPLNDIWPTIMNNNKTVTFINVESADMMDKINEIKQKYNINQEIIIDGFPTIIKIVNNGIVITYDGNIDTNSINDWIKK
jgi:thiol-disulfide isomerase/thioredoxin